MIADLDIYRSAKVLIDQRGEDAPIWAAQKADAMLERCNLDGERLWLRTLAAIETREGGRKNRPYRLIQIPSLPNFQISYPPLTNKHLSPAEKR